jgi:hypothetical protein
MLDRATLSAATRKVGRILVEMDILHGLPESLEIEWRGRCFIQCLDYLGIPFRCSLCRSTSHLRRDCKGLSDEVDEPDGSDFPYGTPDLSTKTGFYGVTYPLRNSNFFGLFLLFSEEQNSPNSYGA